MMQSLLVPFWVLSLTCVHFWAPYAWLYGAVSAAATLHLSAVVAFLAGPPDNAGAIRSDGYLMRELIADAVDDDLMRLDYPIMLAGVGLGILPVTDWYVARVDGQQAIILEHIPEGLSGQASAESRQ